MDEDAEGESGKRAKGTETGKMLCGRHLRQLTLPVSGRGKC